MTIEVSKITPRVLTCKVERMVTPLRNREARKLGRRVSLGKENLVCFLYITFGSVHKTDNVK